MPLISPTPVSYELDAAFPNECSEVFTTPQESPQDVAMFPQPPNTGSRLNASKYKTRLCRNLMESGYCPFQENCGFAHGDHELRDEAAPVTAAAVMSAPSSPTTGLPSYESLYGSPVNSRPPTPPPQYPTRFRYEPYSMSGVAYISE